MMLLPGQQIHFLQVAAAGLEFWLLGGWTKKQELRTIDFRGTKAQYDLAEGALALLERFSVGAHRRVLSQVRRVVAVEIGTEFRTSLRIAYVNFGDFRSCFSVAFLLLLESSMAHVRQRRVMFDPEGRERSTIRVAMKAARRFLEWWMEVRNLSLSERSVWRTWTERLIWEGERAQPSDRRRAILSELAAVLGGGAGSSTE